MKKIKIFLCCLVGALGAAYCIFFAITYEDKYIYYELENLDTAQRKTIESILDKKIPESVIIRSLAVYPTFVPDMHEKCILLSYFDARKNDITGLILENGVEHREKYITILVIQFMAVLAIMGLCLLPYKKIYKKFDGL